LHRWAPRVALGLALFLLLLSSIFLPPVQAADPTYQIVGYVELPGGIAPVPSGVTVDLISSATHAVYATKTISGTSGQFIFNSANTGGALAPGWWGVSVPPQANLSVPGCRPCTIVPQNPLPLYSFRNATQLSNAFSNPVVITGVQPLAGNVTLTGTVTYSGSPAAGASVELLSPTFNGFVVANNTTTTSGTYRLSVPWGRWVLQTTVLGFPNHYNLTQVVISSLGTVTVNPIVGNFLVFGFANLASNPSAHVPNAGNLTLFDVNTGNIYSQPMPAGGFYSAGTYPANFVGPGPQQFDVVVSPIDYTTIWYPISVSSASPTNQRNVLVSPTYPPAVFQTLLNFTTLNLSTGHGSMTATTSALLANDSTLIDLGNQSVGQLWAQLALDFQHNVTFSAANLPTVLDWLNTSGPFFPAVAANTMVNGTTFTQPSSYVFTNSTTCTTFCGLSSPANLTLGYRQSFSLSGRIPVNSTAYGISFTFRHPNAKEVFNYTLSLPAGFVLRAGTTPPPNTRLAGAGPGGTWSKFTLVSEPSSSSSGVAQFTIVKTGNLSANVNISVPSFTYSTHNVVNKTRGGYTVILGVGENATFSGLNSTFPSGTNGTTYAWSYGDGSPLDSTSSPTTNHTYKASGKYSGTLTVTSSGALKNSVAFFVLASVGPAAASITTNATAGETFHTGSGTKYLLLNWSAQLRFNASGSSSVLYSGAPQAGVISVASFTFRANSYTNSMNNFSWSSGVNPFANFSFKFLGNGLYLTSGNVGGTVVPMPVPGWQYTLTLTVWDAAGFSSSQSLVVLVQDRQKPIAAATALNAQGRPIGGGGIVEGSNFTAQVRLSAQNSTDPNNGSIVSYRWNITNSGNSSYGRVILQNATPPSYTMPANPVVWLPPQVRAYSINLTVTDRAGNTAFVVVSLQVSQNTTQRPLMSSSNLTTPTTMTAGTSYTIWVNIRNVGGSASVAMNVMVAFYLLPPSGVGTPNYLGGSGSVQFFNYTNGIVAATPFATGVIPSLGHNVTIRAQISWTPGPVGNWALYANASASNEFSGSYNNGPQTVSVLVTVNQNPLITYAEYGGIAAGAAAVIIVLILLYRRRLARGTPVRGKSSKSGLERSRREEPEDEDER